MNSSRKILTVPGLRGSVGSSRYKKKPVDELSQYQSKKQLLQTENSELEETISKLEADLEENTQELMKLYNENRIERELLERRARTYRSIAHNKRLNKEYLVEVEMLLKADAAYRNNEQD
ncbi:unnamed protein product [Sphagnum balticum]